MRVERDDRERKIRVETDDWLGLRLMTEKFV
jgi:hypothetical protein